MTRLLSVVALEASKYSVAGRLTDELIYKVFSVF